MKVVILGLLTAFTQIQHFALAQDYTLIFKDSIGGNSQYYVARYWTVLNSDFKDNTGEFGQIDPGEYSKYILLQNDSKMSLINLGAQLQDSKGDILLKIMDLNVFIIEMDNNIVTGFPDKLERMSYEDGISQLNKILQHEDLEKISADMDQFVDELIESDRLDFWGIGTKNEKLLIRTYLNRLFSLAEE